LWYEMARRTVMRVTTLRQMGLDDGEESVSQSGATRRFRSWV